MMNNEKEQITVGIDSNRQTITIGLHTFQIKHPVFWKYFGYGAAITGAAIAIYVGLGG